MTYCSYCRKITQDRKIANRWNKSLVMITVHCLKCGIFKHRYLMKKEENSDG